MGLVLASCIVLVALCTLIHYEVLRTLHVSLPSLRIPSRSKLLLVIFASFGAHAVEIGVFGVALYLLVRYFGAGSISGAPGTTIGSYLYLSAETYTSLGFGDLTPTGPVRLMAGVEALNGLLLIGWSASFTYIAMERFWNGRGDENASGR